MNEPADKKAPRLVRDPKVRFLRFLREEPEDSWTDGSLAPEATFPPPAVEGVSHARVPCGTGVLGSATHIGPSDVALDKDNQDFAFHVELESPRGRWILV